MAKKKTKSSTKLAGSENLRVSEKSEFLEFSGNLLLQKDDKEYLERMGLLGRTLKRRARYWCARFRREDETKDREEPVTAHDAPEGFKEYMESLSGFTSWSEYGKSWDLDGENPFRIVLRLVSVWDEWNTTLNRVTIPIDDSPEVRHAKMQALTEDYANKNDE